MTCLQPKALRLPAKPADFSSEQAERITHSMSLAWWGVVTHQAVKAGACFPLGFYLHDLVWHELSLSISYRNGDSFETLCLEVAMYRGSRAEETALPSFIFLLLSLFVFFLMISYP